MGDIIEITTWPGHRNIFYRISSSGIMFEVKGDDSASIGLAKKVGSSCEYWVVIGQNDRTWIKKQGCGGKSLITPNIINNGEYKKFWLMWKNGLIQLGRNDIRTAILSYNHDMEINYVTFMAGESRGNNMIQPIHWRFELPPLLERPKFKPITGGELHWILSEDHLPDGSLIGGYEKETLYIIRATHRGSCTPGKYVPSLGLGFIPWGGMSVEKIQFEVLCGFDCYWVPSTKDIIPVGAVEGGHSEDTYREKLYVGRGLHNGHLIPGKVQPSHRVCYIPYDDREISLKKFEILIAPYQNVRCANRLLIDHIVIDSAPESDSNDGENDDSLNDDE